MILLSRLPEDVLRSIIELLCPSDGYRLDCASLGNACSPAIVSMCQLVLWERKDWRNNEKFFLWIKARGIKFKSWLMVHMSEVALLDFHVLETLSLYVQGANPRDLLDVINSCSRLKNLSINSTNAQLDAILSSVYEGLEDLDCCIPPPYELASIAHHCTRLKKLSLRSMQQITATNLDSKNLTLICANNPLLTQVEVYLELQDDVFVQAISDHCLCLTSLTLHCCSSSSLQILAEMWKRRRIEYFHLRSVMRIEKYSVMIIDASSPLTEPKFQLLETISEDGLREFRILNIPGGREIPVSLLQRVLAKSKNSLLKFSKNNRHVYDDDQAATEFLSSFPSLQTCSSVSCAYI